MSENEYAFGRPPKLEPTFGQLKGQPAVQAKESPSGHISLFLSGENWNSFKSELIALAIECFPEYGFTPQSLEQVFTKTFSNDLIVLLQNKENMNLLTINTYLSTYAFLRNPLSNCSSCRILFTDRRTIFFKCLSPLGGI